MTQDKGQYIKWLAEQTEKGREDLPYFAEHLLGIRFNTAQMDVWRIIKGYLDTKMYPLRLLILAANQIGKTTFAACFILWLCYYKKMNFKEEIDVVTYRELEYTGAVMAPLKSLTKALFYASKQIIEGKYLIRNFTTGQTHFNDCKIKFFKVYSRYTDKFSDVPYHQFMNNSKVEFYTLGGNQGDVLQGTNYYFMLYDELGRSDYLSDEMRDIYNRTQTLRSPLIAMTTPSMDHPLANQWIDEVLDNSEEKGWVTYQADVTKNEYKDQQAAIDSTKGLSDSEKRQILEGKIEVTEEVFYKPPLVTKAFKRRFEVPEIAKGRHYSMGLDTAASSDRFAITILDVTQVPFKEVYREYFKASDKTKEQRLNIVRHAYYRFNEHGGCELTIDCSNEAGPLYLEDLFDCSPIPYRFGIERDTGKHTKYVALEATRLAIEKGHLWLDSDNLLLKRQMSYYKLKDDKLQTDALMSLIIATVKPYLDYLESIKNQDHNKVDYF